MTLFSVYVHAQLKKMSETTKLLPTPEFGTQWVDTLCEVRICIVQ